MHTQRITATPDTIRQVGLPVYPGAKPMGAHVTNQSSRLGFADMTSVDFTTSDDVSRVQAYYVKRIPANAQKIVVPMGFTTTVLYQWYDRDSQKQVLFERVKDITIIHLQSMKLALQRASPSPTAPSSQ
jgi:TRAP-type mannitol/chloroaromatic compound transport system substrate-binding protein